MKLTDVNVTFNPKSKFYKINTITEKRGVVGSQTLLYRPKHVNRPGNSGDYENAEPMQLLFKKFFGHQEVQKTSKMQNRCNCYTGNSMQLLRTSVH